MRRRHGRINRWVLVGLAVIAVLFFFLETRTRRSYRARLYDEKLASSRLAGQGFEVVKQRRERLGIPIDTVNDPNATGLVGVQYSHVTYGRTDLSDALTTLNPNFAAGLVELLFRAGLRAGDTVGLSWDGSFPGLNIQLLAAAQSLGLVPTIITAQSAGMWGANYPGLTWLDIEAELREQGVWDFRSAFCTLGGEADDGRGLSPEGREILSLAAESAGVELFVPEGLEQAKSRRLAALKGAKVLVSAGRVMADIGDPMARVPSRILIRPTTRVGADGVIAVWLESRRSVLFLGNPSRVAIDLRLPVAPVPLPEPGRGRLFFEQRYSVVLALVFAVVILFLLWLVTRYDLESYLGKRQTEEEAI